jgi:trehalose 6-phosphate phosphatase
MQKWDELADIVTAVLAKYSQLQITHGRKVLEIRPRVNWNKGKALSYLLQALGLERDEEVVPLYIGDDRTDEDAFGVLKERKIGCGILVSTIAKMTCASYSLRDPAEVMAFLHQLVAWKDRQGDK